MLAAHDPRLVDLVLRGRGQVLRHQNGPGVPDLDDLPPDVSRRARALQLGRPTVLELASQLLVLPAQGSVPGEEPDDGQDRDRRRRGPARTEDP